MFRPIHDLCDEYLEYYLEHYNIELAPIYQSGIQRTGCMGCPYGHYKHNIEPELGLLDDNQRAYVISLFKESYDIHGVNYQNVQIKLF